MPQVFGDFLIDSIFSILNQLSKEAYEGNRVCISRLAELLESSDESHC